jgi:hypothetical protein
MNVCALTDVGKVGSDVGCRILARPSHVPNVGHNSSEEVLLLRV